MGNLLLEIRQLGEHTTLSVTSPRQVLYHLKSKDSVVVESVLEMPDWESDTYKIASYDMLSTSIEDTFLDLMQKDEVNTKAIYRHIHFRKNLLVTWSFTLFYCLLHIFLPFQQQLVFHERPFHFD
ncbi:hypothetical protein BDP27DRAFT_1326538 [Rhodocollybia butyracea]|uniref:Uncharacterized protein n=1 Tax=Rhodocollybia butyracea TaxID=206335 RepID=A0A9P5PSU0_9AGAR|nr:hypothetical protein BDP27DRAFT_1326538 [Rhodocollybia butyracea]